MLVTYQIIEEKTLDIDIKKLIEISKKELSTDDSDLIYDDIDTNMYNYIYDLTGFEGELDLDEEEAILKAVEEELNNEWY